MGHIKIMTLRRADQCACGAAMPVGARAGWDKTLRCVYCLPCLDRLAAVPAQGAAPVETTVVDVGRPGASALTEFERRRSKREAAVKAEHPRVGGLLLKAFKDPAATTAWRSGAVGEQRMAERLRQYAGPDVFVLHDRRIPGSRSNIDHIAVGPAGVYVIDTKHYDEAKVEIRRSGGLFKPSTERLVVRGRDRTKLITGLAPQVSAVLVALARLQDGAAVPVRPVVAFLGVYGLRRPKVVAGVHVASLTDAAKLTRSPGPLDADMRTRIHRHLASALPPVH